MSEQQATDFTPGDPLTPGEVVSTAPDGVRDRKSRNPLRNLLDSRKRQQVITEEELEQAFKEYQNGTFIKD